MPNREKAIYTEEAGFAYTIATGRLFMDFATFQQMAERLLGRPVWTHEFVDDGTWDELREAWENVALPTVTGLPSKANDPDRATLRTHGLEAEREARMEDRG